MLKMLIILTLYSAINLLYHTHDKSYFFSAADEEKQK